MLDSLVALFLLVMAATAFFSAFPLVRKAQWSSQEESAAGLVASRMIEHLQMLRAREITAENLMALNLVDGPPDGNQFSFTNVPLDQGSRYSPSTMLRNGTGTFTVENIGTGSRRIVMTIRWTSASGAQRELVTGTVIGGYR